MMMVRISQVHAATAPNTDMLVVMTGAGCGVHDADIVYLSTWSVAVTFGDAILGVETAAFLYIEQARIADCNDIVKDPGQLGCRPVLTRCRFWLEA
jgi:hypothetical protein